MEKVCRYDLGELSKPHVTREGFLLAEGYATRTGVFTYMLADGSLRRELRLPEEVGNADSLASLGRKPVTLDHPPVQVNPDNVDKYGVGDVDGEVVYCGADGYVKVKMAIRNRDAIDAIQGGIRELSCGYDCVIDFSPGTTENGEAYDCIQRKIEYNHLALVKQGRAGHAARLRSDSQDAIMVSEDFMDPKFASIEIGGVRYDGVDPVVAKAVADQDKSHRLEIETLKADGASYKAQLDTAKKDLEGKKGEEAQLKTRIADLEAKLAEKEKPKEEEEEEDKEEEEEKKDSAFMSQFNERLQLLALAKRVKLDKAIELPNSKLKIALIKAEAKDIKTDGLDSNFVDGYIRSMVSGMKESDLLDITLSVNGMKADGSSRADKAPNALEDARKDYMANTYGVK